ncbi:MAG: 50S ribosomal protein L17 [Bacteroidia bacterium]|nr:50S ribosomal protein L17 [Bacteroidia bacterium]
MRHGKKIHKIGQGASHRRATMASLAVALIQHKHIQTTLAKARALRPYVEPLITKAKTDTTHSRRIVFSVLQQKTAVHTLFNEIGPKVADRPGGYTRIFKLGPRPGDGAEMALIELVDYNEYLPSTLGKKKTTRRSRRGTGSTKKGAETAATVATAPAAVEIPAAVEAPAAPVAEVVVEAAPEVTEQPEAQAPEAPEAEAPKADTEA